jgi:hypothetical protein
MIISFEVNIYLFKLVPLLQRRGISTRIFNVLLKLTEFFSLSLGRLVEGNEPPLTPPCDWKEPPLTPPNDGNWLPDI